MRSDEANNKSLTRRKPGHWMRAVAGLKPGKSFLASHATTTAVRFAAKKLGIKVKTRVTGRRDEETLTSEVRVWLASEPELAKPSRAKLAAGDTSKESWGIRRRRENDELNLKNCVQVKSPQYPAKPQEWRRALAALKPGEFLLTDDKRLSSLRLAARKLGIKMITRRTGRDDPVTRTPETRVYLADQHIPKRKS